MHGALEREGEVPLLDGERPRRELGDPVGPDCRASSVSAAHAATSPASAIARKLQAERASVPALNQAPRRLEARP